MKRELKVGLPDEWQPALHRSALRDTWCLRLARRMRRSGDDPSASCAARLADRLAAGASPNDEDAAILREWWVALEAKDREVFPGLYSVARGVSPLWRVGSALDFTDAEWVARTAKVREYVEGVSGSRRPAVTVETLADAVIR